MTHLQTIFVLNVKKWKEAEGGFVCTVGGEDVKWYCRITYMRACQLHKGPYKRGNVRITEH